MSKAKRMVYQLGLLDASGQPFTVNVIARSLVMAKAKVARALKIKPGLIVCVKKAVLINGIFGLEQFNG